MSNFLKLEGIVGGAKDPQHIGEIEIENAIFGYTKDVVGRYFGSKNRSGKVIGDISIKKKCDGDSNKLASALVSGKAFPSGKLTLQGTDFDGNANIYTVAMSNILITSISSDNSTETIGLEYENPK